MGNQNTREKLTSKYIIPFLIIIELFLVFNWFTGLFIMLPYYLMNFLIPVIYLGFILYYCNLVKRGFNFDHTGRKINIFAVVISVLTLSAILYIFWGNNTSNLGIGILGLLPIFGGLCLLIVTLLFFSFTMFIINKLIKK